MFGVERIPTPNFGFSVQWTRVGPLQLHLFERPGAAPHSHHFALTVDDIDTVLARAEALDAFDRTTFGHYVHELPGGELQVYLRDPGGNLVEVDWPTVATAGAAVRAQIPPLSKSRPQAPENMQARLFLSPRSGESAGAILMGRRPGRVPAAPAPTPLHPKSAGVAPFEGGIGAHSSLKRRV